ncbi:MAG: DoxX family membrane protein [Thermoguttaceae bacterium]|nr:DoxX family membrane protein [Thermoguttaceae bacterium]
MNGKRVGTWTLVVIVLLVLTRVAIGWHFLFEGIWKMQPENGFSSKGFLGMAQGPTKGFYYLFLPDHDGSERLQMAEVVSGKMEDGKFVKGQSFGWTLPVFETEWYRFYEKFQAQYQLSDEQKKSCDAIFNQYVDSLRSCTVEQRDAIREFLGGRERNEKHLGATHGAEHQKIWDWDQQMKLRSEGSKMADVPEKMGENMRLALWEELTGAQKNLGEMPRLVYGTNKVPGASIVTKIPFIKKFAQPTRLGLLDLMVTVGLSAIGVCLMCGFCTRLAAIAGACFMFNVCLSQFPWPSVYPYSPEVVGHFMIFSKDSAELLALLILAVFPTGRWAGFDWFLWKLFGKRTLRAYGLKKDPLTPEIVPERISPEAEAVK